MLKGRVLKKRRHKNASAVVGDMPDPHVDQGRAQFQYVCKEFLKHPTLKSDITRGLACFDYFVLITLPKSRTTDCYARLFQNFCICGCLAKQLKNFHMDDYLELIDYL